MQDLVSGQGDWPAVLCDLLHTALVSNDATILTAGSTLQNNRLLVICSNILDRLSILAPKHSLSNLHAVRKNEKAAKAHVNSIRVRACESMPVFVPERGCWAQLSQSKLRIARGREAHGLLNGSKHVALLDSVQDPFCVQQQSQLRLWQPSSYHDVLCTT